MSSTRSPVEPHPSSDAPAGRDDGLDLRELGKSLQNVVADSSSEVVATNKLLLLTQHLTNATAIAYFEEDAVGGLSATPLIYAAAPVAESTINKLYSLAMMTRAGQIAQLARSDQSSSQVAVAVPVLRLNHSDEVMVILVTIEQDLNRRLAGLVQIAQFLATYAGQWRGRWDELHAAGDRLRLDRFCQNLIESTASDRLPVAASKMADGLSELLSARLVAIGICRAARQVRLVGLSNQFQFDRSSELGKCLEAVLTETVVSDGSLDDRDPTVRQTEAVRQLASIVNSTEIRRSTLRNADGQTIGACVMMGDQLVAESDDPGVELARRMIGQQLDLQRSVSRRPVRKLADRFKRATRRQKMWIIGTVCTLVLVLFLLPVPHRLKCKCEVQPVKRRFVAAPYEGRLEAAFVEPGDWVTKGQAIARMDAREIRMEMASVEAEQVRAMKQRDTAMAERETAAAQMARFEMERLQLKIGMLQQRMDHLEIKSTTDGVVISGDPKKLEGARMSLGQTLVEVGPLGEMVLEIAISDEDISHAKLDRPVSFRLESLPHVRFRGVLTKIHPRSEQRQSDNVFIGEVLLESNDLLRPGMRGRAKIDASRRSLVWVLFHRAWEKVLFHLG